MTDPKRLLAEGETSPFARNLLAAGRARRDPKGARERVWTAVEGAVATGAATAVVSVSGKPTTAAWVTAGKSKIVALTFATTAFIAGGIMAIGAGRETAESASMSVSTVAAVSSRPDRAETIPEPTPSAITDEVPVKALAAPPPAHPSIPRTHSSQHVDKPRQPEADPVVPAVENPLREEATLLQEARAAIVRGDTSTARIKLDAAETRFPASQLAQEREALEIRVLNAEGNGERAASLARTFLERYPSSLLRGRIESIARAHDNQ